MEALGDNGKEMKEKEPRPIKCWFDTGKPVVPCVGNIVPFAFVETPTKKVADACEGHLKPYLGEGLTPLKSDIVFSRGEDGVHRNSQGQTLSGWRKERGLE